MIDSVSEKLERLCQGLMDKNLFRAEYLYGPGNIENEFKKYFIDDELELETRFFLNTLDDPRLKYRKIGRKDELYQTGLIQIVTENRYILSIYLHNEEICYNFPLTILELAKRFNIDNYKDMSLEDMNVLLSDAMEIETVYNEINDKTLINLVPKIKNSKYKKYLNIDPETVNYYDTEEFSVFAERHAFSNEISSLITCNDNSEGYLTAECSGDGFGYDIYIYDEKNDREKLIEVKSSKLGNFILTSNEYNTMKNTANNEKMDYYVYEYFYDKLNLRLEITKLKYDKETDLLVDEDNNQYELKQEYDTNNKVQYKIERKPIQKILTT